MIEQAQEQQISPMNHVPLSYEDHARRCDNALAGAYRGMMMAAMSLYLARRDLDTLGTWDQFVSERALQHDADEKTLRRYVRVIEKCIEEGWYNPRLTISAVINLCNEELDVEERKRLALEHSTKNGTTAHLKGEIRKAIGDGKVEEGEPKNDPPKTAKESVAARMLALENEVDDFKALLREGVGILETLCENDVDAAEFCEKANQRLSA